MLHFETSRFALFVALAPWWDQYKNERMSPRISIALGKRARWRFFKRRGNGL